MLAKRIQTLEPSGIRRIFELIATMDDPINLSIGQAHFDPPEALVEAACQAIRDGHNRYTVTQGLPELNARVLDLVSSRYGKRPESSFITSGVSGGLMLAFLSLLDPGDEILLPDPNFMMYRQLALICGADIKFYNLYPNWQPDPEEIESLITEKTKVIFLNSPSNPTGGVIERERIEKICEIANRHGLVVISDEIYDEFVYDEGYSSPVSKADCCLQLGGFSKTYGIPGWRMGYVTGPSELLDPMKTLQQFSFVCAPAPFQHAVANVALDLDMSAYIAEYRGKRDRLMEELDPAFQLVAPGGSFYAFPSLPGGVAGAAFIEAALSENMLVVPGSAFSRRDTHFRLSFAVSDQMLGRGITALNELARRFA